jgi:glycine/D-amino acid oxidase-like deaminating enzyme
MSPDVVVIGGGIVGTSCAYFLAGAGLKVLLLERGALASGTSSACQNGVAHVDDGIGRLLTMASTRLWKTIAPQLPVDPELDGTGHLFLAVTEERMQELRRTAVLLQAAGMPCEILDSRQVREREPYVSPDVLGGLFFPEDGKLQPIQATFGFAKAAQVRGAELRTGALVTGIEVGPGGILAVQTCNERIPTGAVVDAAGVWAGSIASMVGLDVPLIPRKGHIVVTEQLPHMLDATLLEVTAFEPVSEDATGLVLGMCVAQTRSGNVLIGTSRQLVGFDCSVDDNVVRQMTERCLRFVPELRHVHAIRSYAGLRPQTPDYMPVIDAPPQVQGFFIATGHGGEGITMAPITGKLVSQMVTGQPTDLPMQDLALSRFGAAPQA